MYGRRLFETLGGPGRFGGRVTGQGGTLPGGALRVCLAGKEKVFFKTALDFFP